MSGKPRYRFPRALRRRVCSPATFSRVLATLAERGYLAGRASIARQLRMPVSAAFEDFDVWEYTVAFVGSGWPGVPFIEPDGYYAGCAPV